MKRAVITGLGVVSPLGCDLGTFWDRMAKGESGIGPITRFDASDYTSRIAGELSGFDPDAYVPKKEQRRMDLFTLYAMAASKQAVADSGFDFAAADPFRSGVIFASGVGGLRTLEIQHESLLNRGPGRCSPFMIPMMIIDIAAGMIAIENNCQGPNMAVVTACASATHAIGESLRLIQRGDADVIITGGSESPICSLGVGGFAAMRALSTRNDDPQHASRPFDVDRDGFVIAEGAATLIMEEYEHAVQRGAHIYAEVAGFGMTCDAHHITAPREDGDGAARAMGLALKDAATETSAVQYVNAHGTSTQLNDVMETAAIKSVLGPEASSKVMVSSTKSMTGHTLGAAGAIEGSAVCLAMDKGMVPPTANHETPDPKCDLDYVPGTAREFDLQVACSNSLGFGGHNACLVFKKV